VSKSEGLLFSLAWMGSCNVEIGVAEIVAADKPQMRREREIRAMTEGRRVGVQAMNWILEFLLKLLF
jgi:hypothetical protein